MADGPVSGLTEQTPILATDVIYVVDPTEVTATNRSKKALMTSVAAYVNSVRPRPINSDTNLYVQWEAEADNYTIVRLSDGYWATVTNNPSETTSAGAWTNRATLTYSVDGT